MKEGNCGVGRHAPLSASAYDGKSKRKACAVLNGGARNEKEALV